MKNQSITSIYNWQSEINFLALFYMLYCNLKIFIRLMEKEFYNKIFMNYEKA